MKGKDEKELSRVQTDLVGELKQTVNAINKWMKRFESNEPVHQEDIEGIVRYGQHKFNQMLANLTVAEYLMWRCKEK